MTTTRSQRQRTDPFGSQDYPANWPDTAGNVRSWASGSCVRCRHRSLVGPRTVLTVHHLTMEKANLSPWNLAPLCQRCHLSVQARVDFDQPYMGEHKQWMEPFVLVRGFCEKFGLDVSGGVSDSPNIWGALMKAIIAMATAGRPICECDDWAAKHSGKATK